MSFEDQLRRTFDALIAELAEAARAERERLVDETRASVGLESEQRLAAAVLAAEARARQEGAAEGRTQGWEDGREHGRSEGRQEAEDASRRAVDEAVAAARAEASAHANVSERLVKGIRALDEARSLGEILDTLVDLASRETPRAAVFLVRGSRLRAWRLAGFDAPPAAASLEIDMRHAGVMADAVGARGASVSDSVPDFARPADAGFAVPLEIAGDVVAVLYADAGAPGAIEILARHAARCLEAITAIKAARVLLEPTKAADADDADASARRYAKLLVSEIKLYHEPAVAAGRRDRDLAARLGGEIARARVLYEQRVPAAVRQRSDYFHDELVRTLANGDPTLLQLT